MGLLTTLCTCYVVPWMHSCGRIGAMMFCEVAVWCIQDTRMVYQAT